MTPLEIGITASDNIIAGVSESGNPAGFWLELFVVMVGFCQSSIGFDAAGHVVRTLAAKYGETLQ